MVMLKLSLSVRSILCIFYPCCSIFVFMSRAAVVMSREVTKKRLYIVRHGQAMHNPRAEVARENGCSLEEFFDLMRQDDVLDSPLTDFGKQQAQQSAQALDKKSIDLVVASSLSRALQTADLVYPPIATSSSPCRRISLEEFREINGDLLNAKRRTRPELQADFAAWNFDQLTDDKDSLWTPEMETFESAAERGYKGLCWILNRPEESILLVSHGGILRYMMNIHPLVKLKDARSQTTAGDPLKPVESRFDNCEVRGYDIQWNDAGDDESCDNSRSDGSPNKDRRSILLTQVDH